MKLPSTPIWQLSKSLKASQLHKIATLIGAPLSGTKTQLIDGIHNILKTVDQHNRDSESLHTGKQNLRDGSKDETLRVLSIDMGIRNLAFALLTVETSSSVRGSREISRPMLRKWQRTSLTDVVPPLSSDVSIAEIDLTAKGPSKAVSKAIVAESFEPPILATHAYNFATYCAALKPTHILIERQRFRSGGQAAVQEWTLRVGMLEAMLYATFHTMKTEKLRGMADTIIEPILPMRVNKYWFRDGTGSESVAKGKQAKLVKIKKVSQMLQDLGTEQAVFDTSETVGEEIIRTFGSANGRKARQKTVGAEQSEKVLGKFDDMADSLLQGLAWLAWQENRVKLLNGGIDALDVVD